MVFEGELDNHPSGQNSARMLYTVARTGEAVQQRIFLACLEAMGNLVVFSLRNSQELSPNKYVSFYRTAGRY